MQVIRMHDYLTYAPKHTKPNVKALRRIMVSFFAAIAITCVICMLIIRRDIVAQDSPPQHRAAVHHCTCKENALR